MSAVYPTAVRSFTARHDFTDYVMAENVNTAQDEITAIQSTLGTNPQINANPPAGGGPVNYGTVANRLHALATHVEIPYGGIICRSIAVPQNVEMYVPFQADDDPYGQFNGFDMTIRTSGWYLVTLTGYWTAQIDATGYRMASLVTGTGAELTSDIRYTGDWIWKGIRNHLAYQGPIQQGTRLRCLLWNSNGGRTPHVLFSTRLRACMIRSYQY